MERAGRRGTGGDGFAWRVSIARIDASGPFSRFPGHERTILFLDGAGMVLDFGVHGCRAVARPLEPPTCPGEWAAECRSIPTLAGRCATPILGGRELLHLDGSREVTAVDLWPAAPPSAARVCRIDVDRGSDAGGRWSAGGEAS